MLHTLKEHGCCLIRLSPAQSAILQKAHAKAQLYFEEFGEVGQ
jgi:hypothetical protein